MLETDRRRADVGLKQFDDLELPWVVNLTRFCCFAEGLQHA